MKIKPGAEVLKRPKIWIYLLRNPRNHNIPYSFLVTLLRLPNDGKYELRSINTEQTIQKIEKVVS